MADSATIPYGQYETDFQNTPLPQSLWDSHLLCRSTSNIIAASTNIGKSLWTQQLALCIAGGIPFLNRQTAVARVLLVQSEIHETFLLARIRLMLSHMLAPVSSIAPTSPHTATPVCTPASAVTAAISANLAIRPHSRRFVLWDSANPSRAAACLDSLRRDIASFAPALLILDPYAAMIRTANPSEARPALDATIKRLIEEFELCILTVAHWNKASRGLVAANRAQAIKGPTDAEDDADTVINLAYLPRTPAPESHATMTIDKARNVQRPLHPLVLRRPSPDHFFFAPDPDVAFDASRSALRGSTELIAALSEQGPMSHDALVAQISARSGVSKRTAKSRIHEATLTNRISRNNQNLYSITPD